jgi:hypothetical protein
MIWKKIENGFVECSTSYVIWPEKVFISGRHSSLYEPVLWGWVRSIQILRGFKLSIDGVEIAKSSCFQVVSMSILNFDYLS